MMNYRTKCLDERINCCWVCGKTDTLEVHHVDGDRSNNDLSNLLPLCGSCHNKVHNTKIGESEDRIESLKDRLPETKKTIIGGVQRTVNFDNEHLRYVLATKGVEQSFSSRVRELVEKGIEVEEQE